MDTCFMFWAPWSLRCDCKLAALRGFVKCFSVRVRLVFWARAVLFFCFTLLECMLTSERSDKRSEEP